MIGATLGWHFYFSFLVVVAPVHKLCSLNASEHSNLCTNGAQAELYSKPMPTYKLQVLTTLPLPANEVLSLKLRRTLHSAGLPTKAPQCQTLTKFSPD